MLGEFGGPVQDPTLGKAAQIAELTLGSVLSGTRIGRSSSNYYSRLEIPERKIQYHSLGSVSFPQEIRRLANMAAQRAAQSWEEPCAVLD